MFPQTGPGRAPLLGASVGRVHVPPGPLRHGPGTSIRDPAMGRWNGPGGGRASRPIADAGGGFARASRSVRRTSAGQRRPDRGRGASLSVFFRSMRGAVASVENRSPRDRSGCAGSPAAAATDRGGAHGWSPGPARGCRIRPPRAFLEGSAPPATGLPAPPPGPRAAVVEWRSDRGGGVRSCPGSAGPCRRRGCRRPDPVAHHSLSCVAKASPVGGLCCRLCPQSYGIRRSGIRPKAAAFGRG